MNQPFVVIENPGLENEREIVAFSTYEKARAYANLLYCYDEDSLWDILYRGEDGNLTSDF